MTKYDQLILNHGVHGAVGDCLRTAVACLLEINPLNVPHFVEQAECNGEKANDLIREYLNGFGMGWGRIFYDPKYTLDEVLKSAAIFCPGSYYLISGKSPGNPEAHHVVVAYGDKVVHDPHPAYNGKADLEQPDEKFYWEINFILYLDPHCAEAIMMERSEYED